MANNTQHKLISWVILICLALVTACAQNPDDKALGKATLELSPTTKAIMVNDNFQYTAVFKDSRGDEQSNINIIWSSSDESIATISSSGEVMGISTGQTDISATVTTGDSGKTESNIVKLTVTDNGDANEITTVNITNGINVFFVGDTVQLEAEAYNLDGETVTATTISWSSSDESIANIDANGNVSFLASGTASIVVTMDNISSAVLTVTVREQNDSRTANFQNAAHAINGTATLQVNDAGNLELVFSENFSVDDGPGLEVFLSNTQTPSQNSANLGSLKSIRGSQSYTVPNSVMIEDYDWVIVHCVPYNVVFGRGQLQ